MNFSKFLDVLIILITSEDLYIRTCITNEINMYTLYNHNHLAKRLTCEFY